MIPPADGRQFLVLARDAIASAFGKDDPVDESLKKYNKEQGVFVTLHKKGELRGCIGYPEPVMPLYDAVIDAAISAAFSDPRFPQVTEDELAELDLEISILTVPEKLECDPEKYGSTIKIGTDGLIIRGRSSGLLLPQVATEWNFSPIQFIEAVCEKAGLSKEAWKDTSNSLFTFQAQIFNEKDT